MSIAAPLLRALEADGLAPEHVTSGEAAIERLAASPPDLVLLDLGLPGIDGIGVCRHIRAHHGALPVLVLTARTGELDEILAFESGADDYVTKPFRLGALLARIRVLLRRQPPPEWAPRAIEVAGLRIDLGAHRASRDGRPLELTPKEFDLLALLAGRAGEALPREEIMAGVWAANWWGSTKTLDVHIAWLRQKLGEPALIQTVRSYGYRLDTP